MTEKTIKTQGDRQAYRQRPTEPLLIEAIQWYPHLCIEGAQIHESQGGLRLHVGGDHYGEIFQPGDYIVFIGDARPGHWSKKSFNRDFELIK